MKLIGKRLIIRDFKFSDAADLFMFGRNPIIGYNAGWQPYPSLDIAKNVLYSHMINKETFCICLKDTREFIGTISLYANTFRNKVNARNLGFSIKQEAWGNEYALEAARLMLDYAFNKLGVDIIGCGHFTYNLRSERVINKLGFQYEGLFRKYKKLYNGEVVDAKWYSMTKDEYERMMENERNENKI